MRILQNPVVQGAISGAAQGAISSPGAMPQGAVRGAVQGAVTAGIDRGRQALIESGRSIVRSYIRKGRRVRTYTRNRGAARVAQFGRNAGHVGRLIVMGLQAGAQAQASGRSFSDADAKAMVERIAASGGRTVDWKGR